jgi:hypothetical protein
VSTKPGRFDLGNVNFTHPHHRFKGALGRRAIRISDRGSEGALIELR